MPRLAAAICAIAAVICAVPPGTALASGPCKTDPEKDSRPLFDGIVLHEESCEKPLYHAFVIEMDLHTPGYRFLVTPYNEKLSKTSEFAALHDAIIAVNGGFWGSSWGGFTMSDGKTWPVESADDAVSTVVGFGKRTKKGRLRVGIRPAEEILEAPLPWMREALFANAVLLEKGKVVEHQIEGPVFKNRNPRTAVGLTKDKGTLLIAVVDGRQDDWSKGMKMTRLAKLLKSYGAWRAANLDGGSSSTMVIPSLGGIVNRPSFKKGPERVVANHLGILRTTEVGPMSALLRLFEPLGMLVSVIHGIPGHMVVWKTLCTSISP
ncbi:MAG: phosphodiester glycosidase family protein [Deltaproteobacteria bacterium]|nr:phosphodiester glycosidase family protein [Deltaproteobacteria bacterium]